MRPETLLHALADGELHSGEALARALGVTRAAVWKQVRALERWGLAVEAFRGAGYRLARPLDLLDAARLRARLADRITIDSLELHCELESTNGYLLAAPPPPPGALAACLAEYQSAGRGRRGRRWTAPLGAGLCLSVAWHFEETPAALPALALAVGVAVERVLAAFGCDGIALKWPNDLVHDERKLGGILIETSSEAHGPCHVVIGVGLNVDMPQALLESISDWPRGATDLRAACASPPARETLAAELIVALGRVLGGYVASGFAPYRERWSDADYLVGRAVSVVAGADVVRGTARGVDFDGALLLELPDGDRQRIVSGDVSVRSAP